MFGLIITEAWKIVSLLILYAEHPVFAYNASNLLSFINTFESLNSQICCKQVA